MKEWRGPDFKTSTPGGTGKPKKPKRATAQFIDEKNERRARKLKCQECRTCSNKEGYRVEPHHIVRRGAPHFGDWHPSNICGLCLACHSAYHSGDDAVKKRIRVALTRAEVEYSDNLAYQGYIDDVYYALPKVNGQTSTAADLTEALA